MFCQSKKKKKDEEKGVYCPIAQKTIQPPKTGLKSLFFIFRSKPKWGASSRWSLGLNSAWPELETPHGAV